MAGIGSWHLPRMVVLVEVLVDQSMVHPAVDPVYDAVGEHEERKYAQSAKQPAPYARDTLVELAVSPNL